MGRPMLTSSTNHPIKRFHVVVVHWTSKKCTKKRDARAELWVCSIVFYVVVVILFVSQLIALCDNAGAFLRDVIISRGY